MTWARARAFVLTLLATLPALAFAAAAANDAPGASGARDVRSFGAICDGASDTAAAFQAAYDALTTSGGAILVPAGARCAIGGAGVEPRSKVELRCEKGSRLVALPGARAMFRTTTTLDDWSVTGCDFDLNGVAVGAWESSGAAHGGARWSFRDNVVHGMPAAAGEPITSVRLDCTLAAGPCLIANNTIFGSEATERHDTCLTVGAGGFVGFNTQLLGNYLQGCGGDCLEVRPPGGITANDNVFVRCRDNAVDNSSLNSVWTGNQFATQGEQAGATMSIHDTIGNQVIVGNQFSMNPRTSAPAIYALAPARWRLAGLYIDDDYAAQGLWFDAQGACRGGSCGGEACDDDGACGACGGRCTDHGIFDHDHVSNLIVTGDIRIESATNLVVQGNIVLGTAGAGPASELRFANPRPDVPSGAIVVSGNQLSKRALPSSDLACIEFDDTGGGGFAGVTVTGNACGQDPAIAANGALAHGVKLTRPPHVWRSILIADNNLANTKGALVGFDAAPIRAATRLSGNLGLGAGDAQPVVATFQANAAAVEAFAALATSAAADASVAPAQAGAGAGAVVGCALDGAAAGGAVAVAVAGIADCLITVAPAPVARGDALAPSAEPGRLAKAGPGERVFGIALQDGAQSGPLRVLIQPAGAAAASGTLTARTQADSVRVASDAPLAEPALSLTLRGGTTYAVDGYLRVRAADAGTGLTTALGEPPGASTSVVARVEPSRPDGSALLASDGTATTIPLAAGDNVVLLTGTVGAAAGGVLELRWAQGRRGPAPLVLQAGSWLRATELP